MKMDAFGQMGQCIAFRPALVQETNNLVYYEKKIYGHSNYDPPNFFRTSNTLERRKVLTVVPKGRLSES